MGAWIQTDVLVGHDPPAEPDEAEVEATQEIEPALDEDKTDEAVSALDTSLPVAQLLQLITDKVVQVETEAKTALDTATVVLKDDSAGNDVKLCLELLEEQYKAVRKAQNVLAGQVAALEGKEDVAPATVEAARSFAPRLEVARAHISQELVLAKRQVLKVQRKAQEE